MTNVDKKVFEILSSETKVKILKELEKRGTTPTYLSKKLNKHKSTIVEHLKILQNSGLVEKETIEGRKRVVYHLTSQGKRLIIPQTTVTLILSSIVASFLAGISFFTTFLYKYAQKTAPKQMMAEQMLMRAQDTANLSNNSTYAVLLYIGIAFLAIGLFTYSYYKRRF